MNARNLRRFAPFGLYLAILAALVSGGLYIVYRSFQLPLQISLAVIVLGLALFVLLDPQRTREALTGRQARYGSNALLMTVAFVGILVAVNWLANTYTKQWDLTEDRMNTLTDQSIETLNSLEQPVRAEAYYTARMPSDGARTLLENYAREGGDQFSFEFIDPDGDPIRAQQANVTRDGTIVLRMGDRQEQVSFASEEELTGAIIRLANPGERAVYFLTGHGEYVIDGASESNYSQVRSALEVKNYTVSTLNLLATPQIPEDALALIIPGPTKPLAQSEVALVQSYLDQGGSVVYLAEPLLVTEFGEAPDPLADYLQQSWGITLEDDLIIDMSSSQQLVAISNSYGDHPITRKMMSQAVVLPSARSVRAGTEAPQGVQLSELALSSQLAWGETDRQSLEQGQVTPDEQQDIIGPVPLAVAGVNSMTGGRVLVVGDSDFAGSQAYTQYGNSDFILNGIDWAAEQENLISLTPRQPIQRFLLPPQNAMLGLILLGSIFLLPGIVLFSGVYVWLKRRKRG